MVMYADAIGSDVMWDDVFVVQQQQQQQLDQNRPTSLQAQERRLRS